MRNFLRAVLRNPDEELMTYLKVNKYQCGVGLMTVANSVSGPLGASPGTKGFSGVGQTCT